MKIENINNLITVLKRFHKYGTVLDVKAWQRKNPNLIFSENDIDCYQTLSVCVGGIIALSTEFQNDGGYVHPFSGCPCIMVDGYNLVGASAIASWLGINVDTASMLTFSMKPKYYVDDSEPSWEKVRNMLEFLKSNGKL